MTDSTKLIERLREMSQGWVQWYAMGPEKTSYFISFDTEWQGTEWIKRQDPAWIEREGIHLVRQHLFSEDDERVRVAADLIEQQAKEIEDARRTAEYWKAEHNAANARIAALESAAKATVPEGCTPADAAMLREANHGLAAENDSLRRALKPFADLVSTDRLSWAMVEYQIDGDPEKQTFQRPKMQRAFNRAADLYRVSDAPAAIDNGGGRDAWQPIETAPRGAKGYSWMMLAWGPEGDQSTGTGMRWGDRFFAAGVFHCLGAEKRYELREVEVHPTHWQPLPAAPAALSQKESKDD